MLSTSRYVADALTRSPESVTWLADDADLEPRTYERLTAEADAILTRSDEPVKSRRRPCAGCAVASSPAPPPPTSPGRSPARARRAA